MTREHKVDPETWKKIRTSDAAGESLAGKKVIIVMQSCSLFEITGEDRLKEGLSNLQRSGLGDSAVSYIL